MGYLEAYDDQMESVPTLMNYSACLRQLRLGEVFDWLFDKREKGRQGTGEICCAAAGHIDLHAIRWIR